MRGKKKEHALTPILRKAVDLSPFKFLSSAHLSMVSKVTE